MLTRSQILGFIVLGFCINVGLTQLASAQSIRTIHKQSDYVWNGSYVGAHFGYGWGSDDNVVRSFGSPNVSVPGTLRKLSGISGGLQGGYNWQLSLKSIVGLEIDASAAAISGENFGNSINIRTRAELNWLGTVRGRMGYIFGPALIYGTGGFAWAIIESTRTQLVGVQGTATPGTAERQTYTATGWTIGGGAELPLIRQWTAKFEYLYFDVGTSTVTRQLAQVYADHTTRWSIVRIGLNYKFGRI